MNQPIYLCLALHNHQPVGNFDHVFEQSYQDSYLPFLDVFERYESLKISLHTSGPLMEWLDAHHPEYLDRLADLVAVGRVEIVGGAFYEPILTMIPPRDRIGQIRDYTRWLESRLGARSARHVDARASLGTAVGQRPAGGGYRLHAAGRLPLQECRLER